MPLTKLKARSEKAQLDHWCKEHQPGKGETEDEFTKRAAKMVRQGVVAQEALGRKTGATFAKAKEPPTVQNSTVATGARLYYESVHGRSETKPTKIVAHHDAGPTRGRQYKFSWQKVGYGAECPIWKSPDWAGKYPDLVEDYEKATSFSLALNAL